MMTRVLCVNALSNQAFWQLPAEVERAIAAKLPPDWELMVVRKLAELPGALRRSSIAIGWPFPVAMAKGAPALAWVHFFTSGIPESWTNARARVTTHRGGSARSVAEHALYLAMAALRGATRSSSLDWTPDRFLPARAADTMHAAIFGFGAIGRELAPLVTPLFAGVTAVARSRPSELPSKVDFAPATAWHEVLRAADVVFLALPLTTETRTLTGPAFFEALCAGAIVVNVASGALVEEADVLAFLGRDARSRYAADVAHPEPYPPDGPLFAHDQVLLTAHVGARREDAWSAIASRTLEVLDEALRSIG
jgi:phosphoglycerate dehydrogenase-like enzyme